jgi:hypothetical protein
MKRVALVLVLLPLPLGAQERATLSCAAEGAPAFEVTLWNPSEFEMPLHCVNAPDLAEQFACAPDGGWGLTDPASPGEALRVAVASPDAASHEGAKLFARVTPSEFVASASAGRELPLALEIAGETFWRMRVSLESGAGVVETREGETAVTCKRL